MVSHFYDLYLLNKCSEIQFESSIIDQIALTDCNSTCIFLEWFQLASEFDLFHLNNRIQSIDTTEISFQNDLIRWPILLKKTDEIFFKTFLFEFK